MSMMRVNTQLVGHSIARALFMISAFVIAATIFAIGAAPPSEALQRRPTIGGTVWDCMGSDDTDTGSEGAIGWCCYSDGCWICTFDMRECEWEQGRGAARLLLSPVNPAETLEFAKPPTGESGGTKDGTMTLSPYGSRIQKGGPLLLPAQ